MLFEELRHSKQPIAVNKDEIAEEPVYTSGCGATVNDAGMQPPLDLRLEFDWLDFSSIANPLGTPKEMIEAMQSALQSNTVKYTPDGESYAMRTMLARYHGMTPDNFLCGSSVSQLVQAVAQSFEPVTVGIIAPSHPQYALAVINAGHNVIDLTLPSSFVTPEPDNIRMYGMQFDAAILANPTYPTSRLLNPGTLKRYLDSCKWVIVDERSIELSLGGESYINLVNEYENLIVVQSLNETYALSGVPISYCIAHPRTIALIKIRYDNTTTCLFNEVLAQHFINQNDYLVQTKDMLETEIPWMQCMLNLIPGINIFPAEANYVMGEFVNDGSLNLQIKDLNELTRRLQLSGFLIKCISGTPGLAENRYFCVSVHTREENEKLIAEMKHIICD